MLCSMYVQDKIYCKGLVEFVGIDGLESALEETKLGGGFVCSIFMFYVVGMFVAVVFCSGIYECVVTDVRSGVEGDLNVNFGRVIIMGTLIMLLEELDY